MRQRNARFLWVPGVIVDTDLDLLEMTGCSVLTLYR